MTRRAMLAAPAAFALKQGRWNDAVELIRKQTKNGEVTSAALLIAQGAGKIRLGFGDVKSPGAAFLIASISKPMTATGLMLLADRGEVSLTDPVRRFIPEFSGGARDQVTIRHLLTHTSGLPDMLPEDQDLRKRHAPLSEFVALTCRTPLLFAPGSEVRYQSMGILLAGEIVSRVAKQPLPAFLAEHVFRPLRMNATSLGLGGRPIAETVRCQVTPPSDWDWNSSYWRNLGSPWGGALSTIDDIDRFLRSFATPDGRVLKPATASAMITNQTAGLNKPWGLGWMCQAAQFGSGSSPLTFGHSGSTGTLCWLDPSRSVSLVLLTSLPAAQSNKTLLTPVSESVSKES